MNSFFYRNINQPLTNRTETMPVVQVLAIATDGSKWVVGTFFPNCPALADIRAGKCDNAHPFTDTNGRRLTQAEFEQRVGMVEISL